MYGFGVSALCREAVPGGEVSELRWCFGEWCRGPQPPENFRYPKSGKICRLCSAKNNLRTTKKRRAQRRKTDPVWAAKEREKALARYHRKSDEEKAEIAKRKRIKYRTDDEYRAKELKYQTARRHKNRPKTAPCPNLTKNGKRCTRMLRCGGSCRWHRGLKRAEAA